AGGPEPARPAAEIGRRAPGRQVAPQAPEGGELVTACAARRLMLVEAPRDRGRRLPVEQVHHLFAKSMAIHHVSPGPDCALRPIMKSGPAPGRCPGFPGGPAPAGAGPGPGRVAS